MSRADTTRLTFLLRLRDRADKLSWPEFHDRYGHLLYRYARSRGASDADAEDIVQEVEMSFFKAIDGFEYDARKGRFRAYLRAAVVHAMGRRASKQAREPCEFDPQVLDHLAAREETDAIWEGEWQLYRLRWAMRQIAGEFDAVTLKSFEMHVLAGLAVAETAAKLDVSKWRVYRARDRVLKRLKEQLDATDPEVEV